MAQPQASWVARAWRTLPSGEGVPLMAVSSRRYMRPGVSRGCSHVPGTPYLRCEAGKLSSSKPCIFQARVDRLVRGPRCCQPPSRPILFLFFFLLRKGFLKLLREPGIRAAYQVSDDAAALPTLTQSCFLSPFIAALQMKATRTIIRVGVRSQVQRSTCWSPESVCRRLLPIIWMQRPAGKLGMKQTSFPPP